MIGVLALSGSLAAAPAATAEPVPAPPPTAATDQPVPGPDPSTTAPGPSAAPAETPGPAGEPPATPTAGPAPTPTPSPAATPSAEGRTLRSAELTVTVAADFPRVLRYRANQGGAELTGSTSPVTAVTLNGRAYPVKAALTGGDDTTARYRLAFEGLSGVELEASIGLSGRVTTFRIDKVTDTEAFRVGTIDIPGHDLVSVGADQEGAATAFTRLDPDSTRTADVFAQVTAQTPVEAAPVGATYAIVNTSGLAAAVESNSTYDKPSGATGRDAARFWHQARKDPSGTVRVGVWSGQWTHRGEGSPVIEEAPWAKVVVTPDANADRKVDWQDGAIAFREIGVKALGSELTKSRPVIHIPFNFASQATHPFLRTLDDVKRVALATDGLGQLALLKGYASEGHDSAHPDYGGNYNKRAGGLDDLNTLLREGKEWNATFGVHVNATEAYPVAKTFHDKLVDPAAKGWNWLDQSYYIDQRRDLNSGELARRFKRLRDETDRNLAALYVDVYYSHGWIADRTLAELRKLGFQVTTEWSDKLERSSLWSHWANDMSYGGATNKGLNSQIIRFIRNHEKDVWNAHPVLGNARIEEFEGWTGEVDFTAFTRNVWEHNLPAKYLQHHPIMKWTDDEIVFADGVRGTARNGKREVWAGDAKVIDGGSYLIPWDGGKFYHFNPGGGATTWSASGPMDVFRLTDQGRVRVATVTPADGKITLQAEAGVPYVLYPAGKAPKQDKPGWGQGTGVHDPGFNGDALDKWSTEGDVRVEVNDKGHRVALLGGGGEAVLEQRIKGLTPGASYVASAHIEVEPGKTRRTAIEVGGAPKLKAENVVERSTAKNFINADEKRGTYFQRVKVAFTSPRDAVTLRVRAGEGDAAVRVDDVRLVRNPAPRDVEDFEHVDQGWGPFVKGDNGPPSDPRTHIAQKHAPYTQAGWNGKTVDDVISGEESLKVHEERQGIVYRTVPHTVRFRPGHAYEVSFSYQNALAGTYSWVTAYDKNGQSVEIRRTPIPERRATTRFTERVVAGCGDVWVGLRSLQAQKAGADFILDDFAVKDLGPSGEQLACASLDVRAGETVEPGAANEVTTTFTNAEDVAAQDVEVRLAVPEGWTVTGDGSAVTVEPGARRAVTWKVTPPIDAPYRSYPLKATVSYRVGGAARTLAAETSVRTLPPPPAKDTWVSDIDWVSSSNGWGPVERDMSNGPQGQGDGTPLTIGGKVFAKGLGMHAPGSVRYFLGGRCTALTASVGVDDSQGTRGTVQFSVVADGRTVAQSPVLKNTDPAWDLRADVSGARHVELRVADGGDGNGNDHASWGDARLTCG
ncbi:endo-alpha-N-acetylgalactosaminidase family protein [Bailinhaonella thermotolerans]|uniref:endo-alpha-N-acetylgalactosaminidase family protein n=1 Tax=Bailinhaonella thermotolerans TaxID=1070861 RepID=UPI00192A490C|nr:endo-alpha-N-acetylgalactosaminidase family protein [Bailinhaonella thermotolerans]